MRKLFILLFFIFIVCNTSSAANSQLAEVLMNNDKNDVKAPKALLNDKDYKIKGRVEYDETGVMFLDTEDVDKFNIKVNLPKKYPKKSVLSDSAILVKTEDHKRIKTPKIDEYTIVPTYNSLVYKSGNFSYGATFGTDMDTAQLEYRTKLFLKYDNRIFGIMTGLGKEAYTSSGTQMSSLYLAPEIKLTEGLSLVDTFKINPDYERCRSDIMLRYSPKIKNSRDILYLEAGAGQTSYYGSGEQMYQFSVLTKFNF